MSLISPGSMFLNYYANACIAHNLYATFYEPEQTYSKRLKKYKLIGGVGFIILIAISYFFNHEEHLTTLRFYDYFLYFSLSKNSLFIRSMYNFIYFMESNFRDVEKKMMFFQCFIIAMIYMIIKEKN